LVIRRAAPPGVIVEVSKFKSAVGRRSVASQTA